MPLVSIVADKEAAMWMQMDPGKGHLLRLRLVKELLREVDDVAK